MGLIAKEVIDLPIFSTSTIRAGAEQVISNQVEWVSVIETPVENFVRKNEFVLTTGIGCHNDQKKLFTFVEDVIRSGASVLAFATGRYIFEIPESILQLANRSNLVLIDIPWDVRFGDIVAKVMQKITLDKQEERDQAELARQQLTNCVLNDKGLQDIVQTLYKFVPLPVAVVDNKKKLRASVGFPTMWFEQVPFDNRSVTPPKETELIGKHPLYYWLQKYNDKQRSIYLLPVINNHKNQGYLLIEAQEIELTWLVMNIFEHALTACALYFVKENAIELTEVRLKDNFVLQLAKQSQLTDRKMIAKGDLLGYDLTLPYIGVVGYMIYDQSLDQGEHDHPNSSSLQSQNYAIQKEITYAANLFHVHTMTTFEAQKVIMFIEMNSDNYLELAHSFLDKVERRISELLKGIEISWGIAVPEQIAELNFSKLYEQANLALSIGMERHDPGARTLYEDTRMDRLLMALSEQSAINTVVEETLKALLAYDEKRQTDLLYTFQVYNQHKGNVSQTARALNLHRQSLLHRLRNIEALTNLSLTNPDDAFLLELTVRIWKLQQLNRNSN